MSENLQFPEGLTEEELKRWVEAAKKALNRLVEMGENPEYKKNYNNFLEKILKTQNNPLREGSHQSIFEQLLEALQESGFQTNPNWRQNGKVFPEPENKLNNKNLTPQTDADLIKPFEKKPDLNFNKEKPVIPDPNFPPKK